MPEFLGELLSPLGEFPVRQLSGRTRHVVHGHAVGITCRKVVEGCSYRREWGVEERAVAELLMGIAGVRVSRDPTYLGHGGMQEREDDGEKRRVMRETGCPYRPVLPTCSGLYTCLVQVTSGRVDVCYTSTAKGSTWKLSRHGRREWKFRLQPEASGCGGETSLGEGKHCAYPFVRPCLARRVGPHLGDPGARRPRPTQLDRDIM